MAGMALVLLFAVTDESGWRPSERNRQTVPPDESRRARSENELSRAMSGAADSWQDIDKALQGGPISASAATTQRLRLRRGDDPDAAPRLPVSVDPPSERGKIREWLNENDDLPERQAPRDLLAPDVDRLGTRQPLDSSLPDGLDEDEPSSSSYTPRFDSQVNLRRGDFGIDQQRPPRLPGTEQWPRQRRPQVQESRSIKSDSFDQRDFDWRGNDREILFEQRMAQRDDPDKQYIVPPREEPLFDRGYRQQPMGDPVSNQPTNDPTVVPIRDGSSGSQTGAIAEHSGVVQQNQPDGLNVRERIREIFDRGKGDAADSQPGERPSSEQPAVSTSGSDMQSMSDTQRRWWPLVLALVGLFASIGFNFYLGWIAWDIHGRYQDVVEDMHELERQTERPDLESERPILSTAGRRAVAG